MLLKLKHTHACRQAARQAGIHARIHTHTHARARTHVRTQTHTLTHTHTHAHTPRLRTVLANLMSVTVFQVVGLKKRVGIEKRFSKAISHNHQHHFCFIIVLLAVDCFAARLLHGTHKTELKESFKKNIYKK